MLLARRKINHQLVASLSYCQESRAYPVFAPIRIRASMDAFGDDGPVPRPVFGDVAPTTAAAEVCGRRYFRNVQQGRRQINQAQRLRNLAALLKLRDPQEQWHMHQLFAEL